MDDKLLKLGWKVASLGLKATFSPAEFLLESGKTVGDYLLDRTQENNAKDWVDELAGAIARSLEGMDELDAERVAGHVGEVLRNHALTEAEITATKFKPEEAAKEVLTRAKDRLDKLPKYERDSTEQVIRQFYAALLKDARMMPALEAEFRKVALGRLDKASPSAAANALVSIPFLPQVVHPELTLGQMLRAEYEGAVEFTGRGKELSDLQKWAGEGKSVRVALYTGAGGMGKTRLMIEACKRMSGEGWRAGFINSKAAEASSAAWEKMVRLSNKTLLVMDYAETRLGDLRKLLETAGSAVTERRQLRILLVARGTGDWWKALWETAPNEVQKLYGGGMVFGPIELVELGKREYFLAAITKEEVYRRAVARFSSILGKKGVDTESPKAIKGERFNNYFLVQMFALIKVYGGFVEPDKPALSDAQWEARVLDETLKHETAYWVKDGRVPAEGIALIDAIRLFMACVTLAGGVDKAGAEKLINGIEPLRRRWGTNPDEVIGKLSAIYPGGKYINPIMPDLLGEHLVQRVFEGDGKAELVPLLFGAEGEMVVEADKKHALTVLARLANRTKENRILEEVLKDRLAFFGKAIIETALETGGPLADVVTTLFKNNTDLAFALAVVSVMPKYSLSLNELSMLVTKTAYDVMKNTADDSEEKRAMQAGLAKNLSVCLSDMGKREEALTATQEAVEISRKLAEKNPDRFPPDLAMSLNNLGNMLSYLGRREEALTATQEAVEISRKLAEKNPNVFLPYLATSLNNLGNQLSALGRREEALEVANEAVEKFRQLAEKNPDAFLPDLATSLNNLGNRLGDMGRREEALEVGQDVSEIFRQLAEKNPDAFLPYLAQSLNNLGIRLSALGRWEEALEVASETVRIRRKLTEKNPDAFLPDLAGSLNNLGAIYSYLGRREEALTASLEAVDIRRKLAEKNPDAFLPDLAGSLNNMGNRLSDLGQREEALTATREAVEKYRELAEKNPDAFLPDLAGSLNNLGAMYSNLERREEALTAKRETVEIRRKLAENNPDAFLPDLAVSLYNLGDELVKVGRSAEGLVTMQEGAKMLLPFFAKHPEAFIGNMVMFLRNIMEVCERENIKPDAELAALWAAILKMMERNKKPPSAD